MQPVNPVLLRRGFAVEALLAPQQAVVAFFSRVGVCAPAVEHVALEEARGRVLAEAVSAGEDYPNAPRSAMDGFALLSSATPGSFDIEGEVRMGEAPGSLSPGRAVKIATGGTLPAGADAVVPIEDAVLRGDVVRVAAPVEAGENVVPCGADMRAGERLLEAGRRIGAAQIGLLATLGVVQVPVYRRPLVAVLSSGDELVDPHLRPARGQVRDSNRYAVAASLVAMGALPKHYPTLCDEADPFEAALVRALRECDGVVVTGGSSVGERDRLPAAVARVASPGVVVHGLRLRPGKPTLLGADGGKPILGLPGNPASALMMLEAVCAPIVGALCGAPVPRAEVSARLAQPARSRAGWTWYLPVRLEDDAEGPLAHPFALRSFSVSLLARADGYVVMGERDEEWPAGMPVTVHRFAGG